MIVYLFNVKNLKKGCLFLTKKIIIFHSLQCRWSSSSRIRSKIKELIPELVLKVVLLQLKALWCLLRKHLRYLILLTLKILKSKTKLTQCINIYYLKGVKIKLIKFNRRNIKTKFSNIFCWICIMNLETNGLI